MTSGVKFDPFSPSFFEDPYPTYRALREHDPRHRAFGMWVLTRYDDVIATLRDRRFSSRLIPDTIRRFKPTVDGPDWVDGFVKKAIVFTEEPDHARLRRLVRDLFDPKAIEAERRRLEAIVERLLDGMTDGAVVEVIETFADRIPLDFNCERLGIPEEMRVRVRDWSHEVRFLLDPGLLSPRQYSRLQETTTDFATYLGTLVEDRLGHPKDDVISRLLAARHGEDRLARDEVVLLSMMTFVAGHETTKYLIGNGILALLEHPEEANKLRSAPELAASAVDELLRFNPPLQYTKRIAIEDVELTGTSIRTDDKVLVCLAAANRDPAQFPDPERFDISRADRGQLGLGYGMRACLGGTMAHLETQIALASFVRRWRGFELATERLDWQNKSRILRGVDQLPLRVHAGHG
jgi:cytochrome P450